MLKKITDILIIYMLARVFFLILFFGFPDGSYNDTIKSNTYNYSNAKVIKIAEGGLIKCPFEFTFDSNTMEGKYHFYHSEDKSEKWTKEKYENFINDLKGCHFEFWTKNYYLEYPGFFSDYSWYISIENGPETIVYRKGNTDPDTMYWYFYKDVLNKYLEPIVQSQ